MTQKQRLRDIYLSRQWLFPTAIFVVAMLVMAVIVGTVGPPYDAPGGTEFHRQAVFLLGSILFLIFLVLLHDVDWRKKEARRTLSSYFRLPPEIRSHWRLWVLIVLAFLLGVGTLTLLEYGKRHPQSMSQLEFVETYLIRA